MDSETRDTLQDIAVDSFDLCGQGWNENQFFYPISIVYRLHFFRLQKHLFPKEKSKMEDRVPVHRLQERVFFLLKSKIIITK